MKLCLFALFASALACSSSTTTDDAGADAGVDATTPPDAANDAPNDSTTDAQTSDAQTTDAAADVAPDVTETCPITEPPPGTTCTEPNLQCTYGQTTCICTQGMFFCN